MIADPSKTQQDLAAHRDRITKLLTQQAQPATFSQDIGDISQSFLSALSQNTGAAGFQQAYNQAGQQRQQKIGNQVQAQSNLYKLMQDEVAQGNEDAVHVDKAIKDVAGDDPQAYEKIATEIHNMPDPVNRSNATLSVAKAANKLGLKSFAQSKSDLDLQEKRGKINLQNAQANYYNQRGDNLGGSGNSNIDPILARQADKDIILKTRESATGANDSLRSLEAIESALFDEKGNPKVQTGKGQSAMQFVGQAIPGLDSSTYQDVQSKATRLSLDTASMLKGQTSDKDVARSLMTAPGYDKTPEANKRIIADQKAALTVVSEAPKFTSAWRNRYGSTLGTDEQGRTFDEAFLDWQKSRFKASGGKIENQGGISPEDAKAELRRRGKL